MSKLRFIHEITAADVGKNRIVKTCPKCCRPEFFSLVDVMGYVQKIDVGKRIYKDTESGVLFVESQEQLNKRIK